MTGLLGRAGSFFLSPPQPVAVFAPEPPADLVAVLAAPADLPAVAGGVAAELRRRHRARAALVCRADPAPAVPPLPAARALARRLAERDLEAVPAGALCHVVVTGEEPARDAWRAITAAAGLPAVIALTARDPGWDALLADADRLLLAPPADAGDAYRDLALASLAELGPPAALVAPPAAFVARRAAALGVARLGLPPAGATA